MCVWMYGHISVEKAKSPHALYLISLLRETFVILNKSHLWLSGDATLKSKISSYSNASVTC